MVCKQGPAADSGWSMLYDLLMNRENRVLLLLGFACVVVAGMGVVKAVLALVW